LQDLSADHEYEKQQDTTLPQTDKIKAIDVKLKAILNGEHTLSCPFEECTDSQFNGRVRDLLRHVLRAHNDVAAELKTSIPFACYACESPFVNADRLSTHINDRHSGVAQDTATMKHKQSLQLYVCKRCQQSFARSDNYTRHRNDVHSEGVFFMCSWYHCYSDLPFACSHDGCTRRFGRLEKLKRHLFQKHDHGKEKKLDAIVVWRDKHHVLLFVKSTDRGIGMFLFV
jgi:hypothetical protein